MILISNGISYLPGVIPKVARELHQNQKNIDPLARQALEESGLSGLSVKDVDAIAITHSQAWAGAKFDCGIELC